MDETPPTRETGFAAYRAVVETARLRDDPDTSWLLEKPELNLWYVANVRKSYLIMDLKESPGLAISDM